MAVSTGAWEKTQLAERGSPVHMHTHTQACTHAHT